MKPFTLLTGIWIIILILCPANQATAKNYKIKLGVELKTNEVNTLSLLKEGATYLVFNRLSHGNLFDLQNQTPADLTFQNGNVLSQSFHIFYLIIIFGIGASLSLLYFIKHRFDKV